MSLLEIDKRLNFILEAQKEKQRHFLKDLSCLIFYGVAYGYSSTQSKKNQLTAERSFHSITDRLLQMDIKSATSEDNVEADLKKLFG